MKYQERKKYKITGITALFLTAVMMVSLSACGGNAADSGLYDDHYAIQDETALIADSGVPMITAAPDMSGAIAAEQLDASGAEETTVEFADMFSSRDLSGTWDASDAVRITLNGAEIISDSNAVNISGSAATITAAGSYIISGALDNGYMIIDAGKDDKIQIILDNAAIHSDQFAALYIKQADKVFLTLAENSVNTLSGGGSFEQIDGDNNKVDGVIFSKDDLTVNGTGKLIINSPAKHGVVCKDDLIITGGEYEITASGHALSAKDNIGVAGGSLTLNAGKDGIHADNDSEADKGNLYIADGNITIQAGDDGITVSGKIQIDGGNLDVKSDEGIEGSYIRINNGVINVYAADDGINAARKSGASETPFIEINGGEITVEVGSGDTDGIDANGNLIITGGVIDVTGNSAFDIDGTITFTGGTVMINGQQVDTIPNQMFGGRGGNRGNMGGNPGGGFGGGHPFPGGDTNGVQIPGESGNQIPSGKTRGNSDGRQFPGVSPDGVQIPGGKNRGAKAGRAEIPDAVTTPTQTVANV